MTDGPKANSGKHVDFCRDTAIFGGLNIANDVCRAGLGRNLAFALAFIVLGGALNSPASVLGALVASKLGVIAAAAFGAYMAFVNIGRLLRCGQQHGPARRFAESR